MKSRVQLLGLAALAAAGFASQATAQSTVYAIDGRQGGRLLNFDPAVPANNQVGLLVLTATHGMFALDWDNAGTTLYGIEFMGGVAGVPCNFGKIDFTAQTFTVIAPITGAGATVLNFTGMSCDPTSGQFYTTDGLSLFKLDVATGNTTLVAAFSGVAGMQAIDMAIDNSGDLYIHDFLGDRMLKCDKATGVCTVLAPTGFLANFAQGMDVDPATNKLYAHIYIGGGVAHWVEVNKTTGVLTTILTTTPWNAELEFAIKGVAPPVCYADCNGDGVLNLSDFGCFQTKFALGDPYADCNGDGVRNLADFGCFSTKFALGCP